LNETVVLIACQMLDVGGAAGDEVVDRDNAMPFREKSVRQVRSEESRAAVTTEIGSKVNE